MLSWVARGWRCNFPRGRVKRSSGGGIHEQGRGSEPARLLRQVSGDGGWRGRAAGHDAGGASADRGAAAPTGGGLPIGGAAAGRELAEAARRGGSSRLRERR